MRMVRQGDVLLMAVEALPSSPLVELQRDDGRVILAYGELTGHAHALADPGVTLLRREGSDEVYLRVARTASLEHEEHDSIVIPAGLYRVVRQREYTPEAVVSVQD